MSTTQQSLRPLSASKGRAADEGKISTAPTLMKSGGSGNGGVVPAAALPMGQRSQTAIVSDRALLSGLSETAHKAFIEKQQRRQLHQLVGMSLSYASSHNSAAALANRPASSTGIVHSSISRLQNGTYNPNKTFSYGMRPDSTFAPLHQYGEGIDVMGNDGNEYVTAPTQSSRGPSGHQARGKWDPSNPNGSDNILDETAAAENEDEANRLYTKEGINHSRGHLLQMEDEKRRRRERQERVKKLLQTEADAIEGKGGEGGQEGEESNDKDGGVPKDDTAPSAVVPSAILENAEAARSRPVAESIIPLYPNHYYPNRPVVANSSTSPTYGLNPNSPSYQPPYGGGGSGSVSPSRSFYPNQHGYGAASFGSQYPVFGKTNGDNANSTMLIGATNASNGMRPSSASTSVSSRSHPASAASRGGKSSRGGKELISALAIAPYPQRSGRPMNGDFLIRALEKDPHNAVAWDCVGALMAEGRLRTHMLEEWMEIAERKREEARIREAQLISEMGTHDDGTGRHNTTASAIADVSRISATEGSGDANNKDKSGASSSPINKLRPWRSTQKEQLLKEKDIEAEKAMRDDRHHIVLSTPAQVSIHHSNPLAFTNQRQRILLGKDITSGAVLGAANTSLVPADPGQSSMYKKVNLDLNKELADDALCDCGDENCKGTHNLGEPVMFCYVNGERYTPTACFATAIEHDPHLGSAWGHLAMWLIKKQREPTLLLMMMGVLGANKSNTNAKNNATNGNGLRAGGRNNTSSSSHRDPFGASTTGSNASHGHSSPYYSYPFGLRAQQMLSDDNAVEDRYYKPAGDGGAHLYPAGDGSDALVDAKGNPAPQHTNYSFVFIDGVPYSMRECLVKALEGFDDTKTNAAAWNYLGVNLGNNFHTNRSNGVGDGGSDEDNDEADEEDEDEDEDLIDENGFGKGWPTDPSVKLGTDLGLSIGGAEGGANQSANDATKRGGRGSIKTAYQKQPANVSVGGRDYNAKKCFQRALECDITFPEAWVNMAMTLNPDGNNPRDCVVIKGKIYTQRQCLMKVLSMHPKYSHAWNTLGFMLEPLVEVVTIVPDEAGAMRIMQSAHSLLDHSDITGKGFSSGQTSDGPYGFAAYAASAGGKGQLDLNASSAEAAKQNPMIPPIQPLLASQYDPVKHARYFPQVLEKERDKRFASQRNAEDAVTRAE